MGVTDVEAVFDALQIEDGDQVLELRGEGETGFGQIGKKGGLDTLPIGGYRRNERGHAHETSVQVWCGNLYFDGGLAKSLVTEQVFV